MGRVDDPVRSFVLLGIVVAAFVSFAFLYFRNVRVAVDDEHLIRRNMWGFDRSIRLSEISRVVRVSNLKGMNSDDGPALFILDAAGRRFLHLVSYSWAPSDIKRILTGMKLEWTTLNGTTSRAQVRQRFRSAVPLWEAHPFIAGIIVAAALFGTIGLAVLVTS